MQLLMRKLLTTLHAGVCFELLFVVRFDMGVELLPTGVGFAACFANEWKFLGVHRAVVIDYFLQ